MRIKRKTLKYIIEALYLAEELANGKFGDVAMPYEDYAHIQGAHSEAVKALRASKARKR